MNTEIFAGKKVLQLIGDSGFGGDTLYLFTLAERMREYGGQVWVGTTAPETIHLAQKKNLPVIPVPALRRPINPIVDIKAFFQVFRICRKYRFDLVHTHTSKPGVVGRIAGRLAGVPVVVHTIHGFPFHDYSSWLEKLLYTKCERIAGRFCDLAISVNHEDRKTALARKILPPEKVVTVINGVDTRRFETPFDRQAFRQSLGVKDNEILVGCIARMAEQKDPKTFIDAAKILTQERANVRCMFVGDGPLLGEMKAYAANLGLGDRLLIPGFKRNVEDYLRSLDIFVLNSLWEGLPYALVEAMCVRLPIVTTNIRGNRECVDDTCALLVKPQQADEIRQAVLKYIDEPAFAAEMAQRAHEVFQEKFTEEQMVDSTFALYEQVFTKKCQPVRNGVYA